MAPVLHDMPYRFDLLPPGEALPADAFALIHEVEGTTLIAPDAGGSWARISLAVHSSLSAVGLSAAIAQALADRGLPANIVAGYHHDHLFVPLPRRDEAMTVLAALAAA